MISNATVTLISNPSHLKTFYYTQVYASLVFYNFLSNTCKYRLERVRASATKIIKPDLQYLERLKFLHLPTLSDFITTASRSVFKKMARNKKHPLFNHIAVNQARVSFRQNIVYCSPKRGIQKRLNSLFPYYMSNGTQLSSLIVLRSSIFNTC